MGDKPMREKVLRKGAVPVKATHSPRAGERIDITWPEARPAQAQPEAIPLDVLFEDASLLVVNKPAGLVVHPAAGHEEHTLVNALLHHCAGSLSGIGGVARPGIVHRLDKQTSGAIRPATRISGGAPTAKHKAAKAAHRSRSVLR